MSSASIAVLVTGDPIPQTRATRGDFLELIRGTTPVHAGLPWHSHDARVLDVLPDLTDALAVIVTGSPLSVTERAPWMERAAAALRDLVRAEVPVLGICFGHQLLGHALGGRVERNPRGREMGSVEFTALEADPVVGGPGSWLVNSTHVDAIVELPPGTSVIGSTALDPYSALRFGPLAWGVQFHPELDAEVMRQYLDARRPVLVQEGFDVESAERSVREAPAGAAVIERFLRVAVESGLRRAS